MQGCTAGAAAGGGVAALVNAALLLVLVMQLHWNCHMQRPVGAMPVLEKAAAAAGLRSG